MKCAICGISVETIDEAVERGWTPCFFDGNQEHEIACPVCSHALLQKGEDGEMEVKEEYRGKLTYFDNETGNEGGKEDLAKEIFFSLENENRRN
jgi:DNA-directed RNA polymerase subunit RPC12/RpoP